MLSGFARHGSSAQLFSSSFGLPYLCTYSSPFMSSSEKITLRARRVQDTSSATSPVCHTGAWLSTLALPPCIRPYTGDQAIRSSQNGPRLCKSLTASSTVRLWSFHASLPVCQSLPLFSRVLC